MPCQCAAAAPAGASAEATAPVADEGGNKTVVMTDRGENKIGVIKALREINPNLTLMDAKGNDRNASCRSFEGC